MKPKLAPVALILLAILSIQSGATLAKQTFPLVGAAGSSALRLVFATAILMAVWKPFGRNRSFALRTEEKRAILLYGASMAGMNLMFYLSLERIPLGLAVAFEFSGPLTVALVRSRRVLDVAWVVCAVLGLGLLLPVVSSVDLDPIGVALALGAGVCWALYMIWGQRAGAAMHGGAAVALGMAVAAALVFPIGVMAAGSRMFSWDVLGPSIGVAILSSALPYSLEMYALKRLPVQVFGVLMSIEPAVAALMGTLFLREQLAAVQWAGIGLVMVASVGSSFVETQTHTEA